MEDLEGRTAVITGGASGIGLALARRCSSEGMRIVVADLDHEALDGAVSDLSGAGASVVGVPTDVRDPASMDRLLDASLEAFGQVDLVCLNAGVAVAGPCWELPLEAWRWVIEVNLFGVVHGIRSFVPHLVEQGHGHVVNTASIAGLIAAPGLGPYAASKHAVVSVSESLVLDLEQAGSSVGVSVLCPAFIRTRLHESTRVGPDGLGDVLREPGSGLEEAQNLFDLLIASGIEVDGVADAVVDAVRTGRFYVLTHPGTPDWVTGRAERIVDAGRPGMPDIG